MAVYRITLKRLVSELTKLSFDESLNTKQLTNAENLYSKNIKYAKEHTWKKFLHAKHSNEEAMCKYFTQRIGSLEPITQLVVIEEREI